MLDRFLRRVWLLGIPVGVLVAVAVLVALRPWHAGTEPGEPSVEQASLRSGAITLVLMNGSEEAVRVAQVIVNDAYVDFRVSQRSLAPDDAERIVISYPWISGESYEIELLLASGDAVEYEIEDAEPGSQSVEAA
jgi:zinc transporter, ZIP family